MEYFELVVKFFTEGFMADIFNWFLGVLALWGLLDVYAMMRFRKSHKVDQSAIVGNWIGLKWMFASRRDEMVAKHPWLGQDLSEVLGEKPDDGEVS